MQSVVPLVSVVIPAYNAEAFIAATLHSILNQTYSRIEVLVIDDGSQDSTPQIVETAALDDDRVRLIQQPNAGVAAARNRGIEAAQGEFVAPIDADDVWYPAAIARMVECFQTASTQTGVVYTWSEDINENGQPIGGFHAATVTGDVLKTLLCHNFLGNASSTLIRRSCLTGISAYDEQLRANHAQGCEDWDLYLRLAEHHTFAVVSDFLVGYRKLSTSMSGDFSQMARSQQFMLEKIRARHPDIPGFLFRLSRSSFYLYLAQQSHLNQNSQATLHWLWQAVQVDPVTPFARPGFYTLGIVNLTKLVLQQGRSPLPQSSLSSNSSNPVVPIPVKDPKANPLKIQLKLWVSSLLHQSLLRI